MPTKRLPSTRRQLLFHATAVGTSLSVITNAHSRPRGPAETLRAFLMAFENCDLPLMESFFAPDATYFDRAQPGSRNVESYERGIGMPAGMRELAEQLPRAGGRAPYHKVEPQNLLIQSFENVALCTFHLLNADTLGRRTVVLNRRHEGWRIVHIHASNVLLK